MSPRPYRAAIIGLTDIGAGRQRPAPGSPLDRPMPISHAQAYHATGVAEVAAVCDLVPALLDRFRAEWGDAWPEARRYTDYRQLFERESIDLVSVVTSDHAHRGVVEAATAAGVKGIYCEKPLATSLADADAMIAAVERAGIPVVVDHTRRFWPLYHQARSLLRDGAIGELARVVATLGGPRAMLFRNGTHLLDTLCFLVESDPVWVVGALDAGFEDYSEYRGDGGRDPATEPGGSAIIQFRSGARAFVNASRGTPEEFSIVLAGSEGRISLTDFALELSQGTPPAGRQIRERSHQFEGIAAGLMELVRLVEDGGESVAGPRVARQTLELILAILASQAGGNCRVDLPLAGGGSPS